MTFKEFLKESKETKENIHKAIIEATEPLIVNLQDKNSKWIEKEIETFEEYRSKQSDDIKFHDMLKEYTSDPEILYLIGAIYKSTGNVLENQNKFYIIDDDRKLKYIERTNESIKDYSIGKLSEALNKYIDEEFEKIEDIKISVGVKGFEISAILYDVKGHRWNFNTVAIEAGGYNVQIWHYRYIIKLSSPEVSSDVIRSRISDKEKAEKENLRLQKISLKAEKNKLIKDKRIATFILELRRRYNDYPELFKDLKPLVLKYNGLNRSTLMDMISRGEISKDSFKPFESIIKLHPTLMFDYSGI